MATSYSREVLCLGCAILLFRRHVLWPFPSAWGATLGNVSIEKLTSWIENTKANRAIWIPRVVDFCNDCGTPDASRKLSSWCSECDVMDNAPH